MTDTDDRVPVQGDGMYWLSESDLRKRGLRAHEPGSVARSEFTLAHLMYMIGGGTQSANRILERGGFSFFELTNLLGHEPETFEPISDKHRSTVCPICGVNESSVTIASKTRCLAQS